jgi:hypothetical protein
MTRRKSTPFNSPTVHQRTPDTATVQTQEASAVQPAPPPTSPSKVDLSPRNDAQQPSKSTTIEEDLLASFKEFSIVEKLRIAVRHKLFAFEK